MDIGTIRRHVENCKKYKKSTAEIDQELNHIAKPGQMNDMTIAIERTMTDNFHYWMLAGILYRCPRIRK